MLSLALGSAQSLLSARFSLMSREGRLTEPTPVAAPATGISPHAPKLLSGLDYSG